MSRAQRTSGRAPRSRSAGQRARAAVAVSAPARPLRRKRARLPWTRLSDDKLLSLRFCDLGLSIARSPLARRVKRLYAELENRGIEFRPHVWLAEEWFSPDGVPGIAVPFYLAHPRLERLERRIMREAEGGNARWLMRILRHEAGHALDNAYRLRRRKCWREVFGPASMPYPHRYRARPGSRRYVHHLGEWYAQSHPTEDFAETFAVWLKPNSDWRRTYAGWPAFHKLRLVDELMASVRGRTPAVRNRIRIEPVDSNTRTLAQHYRLKLARHQHYRRGIADELLRKIFSADRTHARAMRASTLLRMLKPRVLATIARDCDVERYTVEQIHRMVIERGERLNLHVRGNRRNAMRNARWMLARLTRLYGQGETPHLPL
jgi:Putative zinc-binding metallo-peptidase